MALVLNPVAPLVNYVATAGQTVFTVPFAFFAYADLVVTVNGQACTYNAVPVGNRQFSATGANVAAGGTITFGTGLVLSDAVKILRNTVIQRTANFPVSGPFDIEALNVEQAVTVAVLQEQALLPNLALQGISDAQAAAAAAASSASAASGSAATAASAVIATSASANAAASSASAASDAASTAASAASTAATAALATKLSKASNLSDLASLASALGNLGFGGAATAAGYVKIPNAADPTKPFILQWGGTGTLSLSGSTVALPIAFPNAIFAVTLTTLASAARFSSAGALTVSNFTAYSWADTGAASTGSAYFIAIGY